MAPSVALTDLHWLQGHDPVVAAGEPLPSRAEVVVIGGGYVGGATAYWLARRGVEVLLIERRGVSSGAAGRNAGFIAPGLGMSFAEAVARYGRAGAVQRLSFTRRGRALALTLIDELAIDCDLEAPGGLTIATSPEEWRAIQESGAALRREGFAFELLDRDALQRHVDAPLPKRFLGALFNPETLLVNPAKLNNGIVRGALERGAHLALGVEVHGLAEQDSGVTVRTNRGEINARYAVLATNAWSPQIAPFLVERIAPVRGQIFATAPAPRIFRRAMSANQGYEYWSQRRDGRIILGGARWAAADRDEGYYAEELNPTIQDALVRFLVESFPALAGVRVERRWSGIMGFSRDGYPLIGRLPGNGRLLVAAGFTGHGGPYFAVAGKSIAELIVDGRSEEPLHAYAPERE
jgi:glycine/D-amino acid oxidase-like deaminating enzyme